MRRILLFLLILASALALGACAQGQSPRATTAAAVRLDVLVDPEWVAAHLADSQVRLLDVSSKKELYDQGHLPGAVYVNVSELASPKNAPTSLARLETRLGELGIKRDTTLVLYDDMQSLYAARAFWLLKQVGHERVAVLNGGSARWTQEKRETSKETPKVAPTAYSAAPATPGYRATWDYVLPRLQKTGIALVDARTPAEYTGEQVRGARGGHIPGAVNVEWNKAMRPDGTFRSAEELERLFQRAGVTRDSEIITYCQTGVRGSHAWFVLKYLLGFKNVTLYEGSWEEWSAKGELPVSAEIVKAEPTPTRIPDPCE
ncbi:thiosulfate/3-mercaptopyruvate sulfurtransferase [Anaerolineae bacterium]|nr:thiosulfate/3-mercaptopyruvate sulfurtransferase [Anaerolineae bacterium]